MPSTTTKTPPIQWIGGVVFTQGEGLVVHPHTAAGQRLLGCGDGGAERHARVGGGPRCVRVAGGAAAQRFSGAGLCAARGEGAVGLDALLTRPTIQNMRILSNRQLERLHCGNGSRFSEHCGRICGNR